jgi:thiamine biosynthesis lipoprotein
MASQRVQRTRPLLGTFVTVRVGGLAEDPANAAIDRAFAEVARLHALMSFHEADSELTRLNREAAHGWVSIGPDMQAVLALAGQLAADSRGVFDIAVGAPLVAAGLLPAPATPPVPTSGDWRDIRLAGNRVRFDRPLWIDLGGIAKGYAVDRALAAMALPPDAAACVDAGGDLRVIGPDPERVVLRAGVDPVPVIELQDAALASSTGRPRLQGSDSRMPPHLDGRTRRPVGTRSFVTVVAPSCVLADALTKVVLARHDAAAPLLRRHGGTAYLHTAGRGWRVLG